MYIYKWFCSNLYTIAQKPDNFVFWTAIKTKARNYHPRTFVVAPHTLASANSNGTKKYTIYKE